MEFKKLSEVADIHSGLVLGRKEADASDRETHLYKQLNLRSISENGSIDIALLDDFLSAEAINPQFITKVNDVIMRLFAPLCPVLITTDFTDLVVPSQLAIIRTDGRFITPEFVCIYLSQKSVMNEIVADGDLSMRSIRIGALSDVKIPMLPKKRQEEVALFTRAHMNRKKLYLDMLHQYDIQTEAALRMIIEREQ